MTAPTQTTAPDPFAAVQVPGAAPAPASAGYSDGMQPADPFNGVDVDTSDPFATGETVNAGGNFRPTPSPEALAGRLVVYIPRSFRKDALVPKDFAKVQGETREEWRADLYVIDRAPLTYTAKRTDQQTQAVTTETITLAAEDMPAEFLDIFVAQAALIGQLRKVDGTAKPLLMGVLRRGPKADQKRAGKTFAQVEAEYAAWMANMAKGIRGTEPAFSWQVDVDVTPDQRAAALAWWKSVATTIKPLGKAIDRTGQTGR